MVFAYVRVCIDFCISLQRQGECVRVCVRECRWLAGWLYTKSSTIVGKKTARQHIHVRQRQQGNLFTRAEGRGGTDGRAGMGDLCGADTASRTTRRL